MKSNKILNFLMLFSISFSYSINAEPIPLEKLLCGGSASGGTLSPSGRYYAAMVPSTPPKCSIDEPEDDEMINVLVVIDLEDGMKAKRLSGTSMNARVSSFTWLNDKTLYITRAFDYQAGTSMNVDSYSLYTIDRDGKNLKALYKAKQSKSGGIKFPRMVDTLPQFPNKVLISINRRPSVAYKYRDVYMLDLDTNETTLVAAEPVLEGEMFGSWILDNNAVPRGFSSSHDFKEDGKPNSPRDGLYDYYYSYNANDGSFKKMWSCENREACFHPTTFDFDNRHLFGVGQAINVDGSVHEYTDTNALWLFDTKTEKFVEKVFHDKDFDFSNPEWGSSNGYVIKDVVNKKLLGLSYYTSKREYIYFDQNYANVRQGIEAAFPGETVSISANDDFNKFIINTSSDRHIRTTYLYDPNVGIQLIDKYAPWLEEYEFGKMEPFSFTARDGLKLHGYITLPPNYKKGSKIPFILHPHGGPHAADSFGFRREVQLYATRGYGVVQVNFRGSVGYGLDHMNAAKKQWSLDMHTDLLDGLFWANDQGYVDMENVCISGASYGGYSAMVGITKNPDLFKCAINYVGVVNLVSIMGDKQWMFADMGRPAWNKGMGHQDDDRELLERASPINYLDNIKGDLFVIHGRRDRNVSYKQVLELKNALDDKNIPYEYMIRGDEAHGFYAETNNLELYVEMEKFLKRNLN
ncbi:S9 family peptidase [Gammaproteobacteria bacterium]|nr:S9 family peptidase [Gammaproteobacteria bacterium]|tara:strand:- start:3128 stop:5203 length:2076 start_codon:yes stop_codon:yes gene_type:complete